MKMKRNGVVVLSLFISLFISLYLEPGLASVPLPTTGTTATVNTSQDPWYYSGAPDGSLSAAYVLQMPKPVTNAYTWTSADGKQTVGYNMTTGHLNVAVNSGQKGIVSGAMLYRSYVQTPQTNTTVSQNRPITFIYNGGPGSSADYLQTASFGPRSVRMSMPNQKTEGFGSGDWYDNNPNSIINDTDMVYINPIGTLGSTAISPGSNRDFWSVDVDAQSIATFINNYLALTGRTQSPVYLMGESYGTARSAAVANVIAQQFKGINLKGITLISSILNGTNIMAVSGSLPSIAADAYYNNRVNWAALGKNPNTIPSLQDFLAEVTSFADNTVRPEEQLSSGPLIVSLLLDLVSGGGALSQQALSARQQSFISDLLSGRYSSNGVLNFYELADQIVALQDNPPVNSDVAAAAFGQMVGLLVGDLLTGHSLAYSPDVISKIQAYTGTSITPTMAGLAWSQGIVSGAYLNNGLPVYLGMYDGRVNSLTPPNAAMHGSDDPAMRLIDPIVSWGIGLLGNDSGYSIASYNTSSTLNDRVIEIWDWSHKQPDGVTTLGRNTLNIALDLRAAMTVYPDLKVYQADGYFDVVTPFHATEQTYGNTFGDLAGQQMLKRITLNSYATGHMTYTTADVAQAQKAELDAFYSQAGTQ
jgi:carboxypeptidase C (cathepsin A)